MTVLCTVGVGHVHGALGMLMTIFAMSMMFTLCNYLVRHRSDTEYMKLECHGKIGPVAKLVRGTNFGGKTPVKSSPHAPKMVRLAQTMDV